MLLCRNEHRFLLAGLKIEKLADWAARQAAYAKAVKEFLPKLKQDFSEVEIKFVRAISVGRGQEARLVLSVDCGSIEEYVFIFCQFANLHFVILTLMLESAVYD
jgi:hypothetical protein